MSGLNAIAKECVAAWCAMATMTADIDPKPKESHPARCADFGRTKVRSLANSAIQSTLDEQTVTRQTEADHEKHHGGEAICGRPDLIADEPLRIDKRTLE